MYIKKGQVERQGQQRITRERLIAIKPTSEASSVVIVSIKSSIKNRLVVPFERQPAN